MFDISLIDAGILPAMTIALVAGIFSFLSPCVLPIVPPYLAYMSGTTLADLSAGDRRRNAAVVPAIFFVMGLSTIFLILGFAASVAGTYAHRRPARSAGAHTVSRFSESESEPETKTLRTPVTRAMCSTALRYSSVAWTGASIFLSLPTLQRGSSFCRV